VQMWGTPLQPSRPLLALAADMLQSDSAQQAPGPWVHGQMDVVSSTFGGEVAGIHTMVYNASFTAVFQAHGLCMWADARAQLNSLASNLCAHISTFLACAM
jgi:hypothetical protein